LSYNNDDEKSSSNNINTSNYNINKEAELDEGEQVCPRITMITVMPIMIGISL
jgi:hypothetical protein